MGMSAYAILAYGINLGEDYPEQFRVVIDDLPDEEDYPDFDEFINQEAGLTYDNSSYEDRKKARESCPAEIVTHSTYDYPGYILAMRGSVIQASWGDSVVISGDTLEHISVYDGEFKEWCRNHGIEIEENYPRWHLVALWG